MVNDDIILSYTFWFEHDGIFCLLAKKGLYDKSNMVSDSH